MQKISEQALGYFQNIDWQKILHNTVFCKTFWIVFAILFAMYLLKKMCTKNKITIKSSNGDNVILSTNAINEIVMSVCAKLSTIVDPRIFIKTNGKKFIIFIKIKVELNTNLSEITAELNNSLKNVFSKDLCLGNSIAFNMIVSGFLSMKSAQKMAKFYQKKYGITSIHMMSLADETL